MSRIKKRYCVVKIYSRTQDRTVVFRSRFKWIASGVAHWFDFWSPDRWFYMLATETSSGLDFEV